MKKGWTYKKLGEVAAFMSGYTPDKSELISQGKYPYFKVAEMNNPGNELFMRYTSFFIDSPKKVFPKGAIIFPKNGGAIYTEKKRILEYDSVIDLNSEAIFPNEQIVLKYLFCFLNHIKISSFDKGGGLPSLDLKKMANCLIPLPALSEQNKIVKRLDAAFAQIDELKANAEKQLAEARALFQKALAKAMEPKKGWEEKNLNDICTDIVDCPHSTPRKVDHPTKYPCIRTSELKGGRIEWESMQYLDEEEYIVRTARIKPQPYDIVYGREGTYGDAVLLPEGYYFSLGQRTMLFRPDTNYVLPKFLHYSVISSHVYEQAKAKNSGCGVGHVNVKDIKVFIIGIPKSLSEQQRIVERLDSISENIRKYEEIQQKIITECDALKQALLRQVFE